MARKRVLILGIGSGILLGVVLGALILRPEAALAAPARIVLVDPDEDDVVEGTIKTRDNGDGAGRGVFEVELNPMKEGFDYFFRIEVIEVGGELISPLEVGPLTAQPPR